MAGGLQQMLPLSKLVFASLGLCCLLTAVGPQFSHLSNGFDMSTYDRIVSIIKIKYSVNTH